MRWRWPKAGGDARGDRVGVERFPDWEQWVVGCLGAGFAVAFLGDRKLGTARDKASSRRRPGSIPKFAARGMVGLGPSLRWGDRDGIFQI